MKNKIFLSRRNFIKFISLLAVITAFKINSKENRNKFSLKDSKKNIERDLVKWDSIEIHRTGTEGDNETAYWLADEIKRLHLVPELDSFNFTMRTPRKSIVTNGFHIAKGLPLFDGGSTSPDGIKGAVGSLKDKNVIAVAKYGSSTMDEATIKLNNARKRNEHPAIVAIADVSPSKPGLAVLNAESYRNPFGPPVLQVATKEADWLLNLKKNEKLTVFAELKNQSSEALNVQTQIKGKDPSLNPLVVMTPKSGWWTCTSERGGGIVVWLNSLRHLSKYQPLRTVIFTANSGHELSHLGLDHFLENNSSLVRGAHAWVHLGANFAAKKGQVLWQASTQNYMDLGLLELRKENLKDIQSWPVSSRPLGEARNIFDGNGEYISLLGSNPFFHHPDDKWPESIDMNKLIKLNNMMLKMISSMANSTR